MPQEQAILDVIALIKAALADFPPASQQAILEAVQLILTEEPSRQTAPH